METVTDRHIKDQLQTEDCQMFVVCIVLTMKGELFASDLFFHLNCADYTAYLKLIM